MYIFNTCVLTFLFFTELQVSGSRDRRGYGPYKQKYNYVALSDECSHIFYWFFECFETYNLDEEEKSNVPIIIIPGANGQSASGVHCVLQSGPFNISGYPRENTLVKHFHVLYIDLPVGTGFSYTTCRNSFRRNNTVVADDLIEVINYFFKRNPSYQTTPVYLYGQSFGGKVVAKAALKLQKLIEDGLIKVNLVGIFLASAWIDPISNIHSWPEKLHAMDLLDSNAMSTLHISAKKLEDAVTSRKYKEATAMYFDYENEMKELTSGLNFCNLMSGITDDFQLNYFRGKYVPAMVKCGQNEYLRRFMNEQVKKSLSDVIGSNRFFDQYTYKAVGYLAYDLMSSVRESVDRILQDTELQVFVLTGQLDLLTNGLATQDWISSLNWSGTHNYYSAVNEPLLSFSHMRNKVIVGYHKKYENLQHFSILHSGHHIFYDAPYVVLNIIKKATRF